MLHTINQSPFRSDTFSTSVRFIQNSDPVLFMEDGVYALQEGNKFSEQVKTLSKTNPVYALAPDIKARGLRIMSDIKQIDYDGFVELVEKHQVNTWF